MPKVNPDRQNVQLGLDGGETVPGILQIPRSPARVPAVLLLHGFTSRKERMADSIGRALLRRNVASLAIDLPLHGERPGGLERASLSNPLTLVQNWRLATREAHAALDFLAVHDAVDPRGIALAGYSLGAYLSVAVAASNKLVRALALAAGGDLPRDTPFASLVRAIYDPLRAVRALAGRPLLMVNGRNDRTIRPAQAESLFAAAEEPKELRWYDGGHWTPAPVVNEVAEWLATRLEARPSAPSEPRDEPANSSRRPRLRRAS
jgi:fermentation-respiration switch protein FrsA (DUF1100 family)